MSILFEFQIEILVLFLSQTRVEVSRRGTNPTMLKRRAIDRSSGGLCC